MSDRVDFEKLFADTLTGTMVSTLGKHGIDHLPKNDLEQMARECTSACYGESIGEFNRAVSEPIDYKTLFAQTVEDMVVEVFGRHGIDTLYEDELEAIVRECTDRCYHQSIGEFRRRQGLSVFKRRTTWM